LFEAPANVLRVRGGAEVELRNRQLSHNSSAGEGGWTYRKCAFSEDDDVHVERLKVCRAILILVETSETNEIVIPEKFNLFTRFFHENIFRCQWMDIEDL
jgi:hypothetical protein